MITFPKNYLAIYLLAVPCLTIGVLSSLGVYGLYASGFALMCFCFLLFELANRKTLFLILLPICFSFVWLCASVLYLETGVYAPEIQEYTNVNGSSGRLISLLTIFLLTIFLVLPTKVIRKMRSLRKLESAIFNFYVFIMVVFIVNGVVFGFPIISLEQRFYYWGSHPIGSFLLKMLSFTGYLFLFVGWRIGHGVNWQGKFRIDNLYWKFLVIIFFLIGLLYANKASYFLVVTLHFLSGYIIAKSYDQEKFSVLRAFPIRILLVVGTLIVSVSLLSYRYVHGYGGGELVDMLLTRIFAMQGQLWWAIENIGMANAEGFIDMLIKDSEGGPYGIFLIMREIMPPSSFAFYFDNKVPLTGGFPAMFSLYFSSPLVVVLLIVFGVFSGFIYSGVVKAMISGGYEFFIWVIMLSSLSWVISLGSLNILTSPIFVISFLTLIMLSFFRNILRTFTVRHKQKLYDSAHDFSKTD